MERFKLIASVYLILVKNNQILLMRRRNTGYEDGKYGLPSGHLEDNESLINGLMRETQEEIGIELVKDSLSLNSVLHRKEEDIRIDFFFTASKFNGKIRNAEPEKCDELAWFNVNNLPENTIGYIQEAIINYQNGKIYSERGW